MLISLFIITACSTEIVPQASTNQFIKGPFNLTTEWQTFRLDKPLETLPHVQILYLFLDDDYQNINDIEPTEFYITNYGYKYHSTNLAIKPEIILIDSNGREFPSYAKMIGWYKTPEGDYNFLGFGTNPNNGKFNYPKGTEIVAIKARANSPVTAPHLGWYAPWYFQNPKKTWKDVHASEVVSLEAVDLSV
ncbi:MAG: hypothetical protein KTR20_03700 [Cellvibrionaceae bacterium]|nr:hypothetical protein [Cellvibrionaceae bacterium]